MLIASNKEFESENACLKEDLERAMRAPQGKGDTLMSKPPQVGNKWERSHLSYQKRRAR